MTRIPFLGESLSLTAALIWAVAVILFRKSGEKTPALALNLFKNAIAVILLALTLPLTGTSFFPDRPLSDWALLAGSGILGISIADTLFFLALERLGAGLVAIIDTLYSPAVIVLSFFFLGEHVGIQAGFGAALIVSAIVVGDADRPPMGSTPRDIAIGTLLGAIAMGCMAAGIVMVKRSLETAPVLWAAAVRVFFGGLGLLPLMAVRRWRADMCAIFRPSRVWRVAIPGSVLGAYLSMTIWLGGFKFTDASIAAVLNQMTTIFIFVFAAIFLKEPLTPRRTIAVLMAMTGAILVALR